MARVNKELISCNPNPQITVQNTTEVIPISGASAFEDWKAYYGSQYPEIQTFQQWVESGYGGMNTYEQFEI